MIWFSCSFCVRNLGRLIRLTCTCLFASQAASSQLPHLLLLHLNGLLFAMANLWMSQDRPLSTLYIGPTLEENQSRTLENQISSLTPNLLYKIHFSKSMSIIYLTQKAYIGCLEVRKCFQMQMNYLVDLYLIHLKYFIRFTLSLISEKYVMVSDVMMWGYDCNWAHIVSLMIWILTKASLFPAFNSTIFFSYA